VVTLVLEIRVLPGPERLARLAFLALVRRVKLARVVAWAVSPVLSLALAALLARPPQADRVGQVTAIIFSVKRIFLEAVAAEVVVDRVEKITKRPVVVAEAAVL
jgi:hypothetical protein